MDCGLRDNGEGTGDEALGRVTDEMPSPSDPPGDAGNAILGLELSYTLGVRSRLCMGAGGISTGGSLGPLINGEDGDRGEREGILLGLASVRLRR